MALYVLLRAEAAGVQIRIAEDGTLQMEAASAPDPEHVALLREHRAALLVLLDHAAAEAPAMVDHYATPAGAMLPDRDPMTEGLLRGFRTRRGGEPA